VGFNVKLLAVPEIEQQLIAGMLMSPEVMYEAEVVLQQEWIYTQAYAEVYRIIRHYLDKGVRPDVITVESHLKKEGKFDAVGGMDLIMNLLGGGTTSALVESHVELIREMFVARNLYQKITSVQQRLMGDSEVGVYDHLDDISAFISNIGAVDLKEQGLTPEEILEIEKDRPAAEQLKTGVHVLDKRLFATSGMYRGHVLLTQAITGHGKTRWALWLHTALARQGYKTAWFQLEDYRGKTAKLLYDRSLEFNKNLYVYDEVYDIEQIKREARRKKRESGIDAIVVDYVQNVTNISMAKATRDNIMENVSMQFTRLAKELKIVVHLLSQVTIDGTKRTGWAAFPRAYDARWSKQFNQDAHNVISFFRPAVQEGCVSYEFDPVARQDAPVVHDWKRRKIHQDSCFIRKIKDRYSQPDNNVYHLIDEDVKGFRTPDESQHETTMEFEDEAKF
jgi:replicative DNA helicase